MTANDGQLVAGRSCDGCTMCCKLLAVDAIEKPRAAWCPHCDQKRGCTIYECRPDACRGFHCGYLRLPQLDDRWKPSKAKFLINYEDHARRIVIHADPQRPDAWRADPYIKTIRHWAALSSREGSFVLVWTGQNATIVLPDREINLGQVREDQVIVPVEKRTQRGVEVTFEVRDP